MSNGKKWSKDVPKRVQEMADRHYKKSRKEIKKEMERVEKDFYTAFGKNLCRFAAKGKNAYYKHIDENVQSELKSELPADVLKIIKGWKVKDHKDDGIAMLKMFLALHYDADRAAVLLDKTASKQAKMVTLLEEYSSWFAAWRKEKGKRQVMHETLYGVYSESGAALRSYLREGWEKVSERWSELKQNSSGIMERAEYIEEVFNQPSPKGYSRAWKEACDWKSPREIGSAYNAMRRFLAGTSLSNSNIFTGGNSDYTPAEQIVKEWKNIIPGEKYYRNMWDNIIRNVFIKQLRTLPEKDIYTKADKTNLKMAVINNLKGIAKAFGQENAQVLKNDMYINVQHRGVIEFLDSILDYTLNIVKGKKVKAAKTEKVMPGQLSNFFDDTHKDIMNASRQSTRDEWIRKNSDREFKRIGAEAWYKIKSFSDGQFIFQQVR